MEEEQRFTELLQPLRDLAANFDIDIAESLENYLEELEGISFSLDGKKGLNFAEAALLIQGSTTIYSRKVEHLHKLVLQALELVTSKKDNKKNNNNNDDKELTSKNSKELQHFIDEERLIFGTDPTYLLLDDVLEEGKNIDLEPETAEARDKRRSSGRYSLSGEISRASMILMHSILAEDHSGASLKISCQVDQSGALIMGGILPLQSNSSRLFIDQAMEKVTDNSAQFFPHHDDDGGAYDDDDGNYNYGDDDADVMEQPLEQLNPVQKNATSQITIAPRKSHKKTSTSLLDPYERVTGSKAIKKGSTFRIPTIASRNRQSLNDKTSSAAVFENLLLDKIPLTGIVNLQFKDIVKYQKSIYLKNARRLRSTQDQNDDVFLYKEVNDDEERRDAIDVNAVDDNDVGGAWYDEGGMDDDDDCNYNNNFEPVPEYEDNVESIVNNVLSEEVELARRVERALSEGFSQTESNSYEMLCRRHIQNFMQGAEQYARETQLSKRVSEWTKRLEPLLKEEEKAEVFDIHQYSDKLLTKVVEVLKEPENPVSPDIVSFNEIVEGQSSAEVCRVFLACLQLANVGNLDVIHRENTSTKKSFDEDSSTNNLFKLRLIDSSRFNDMKKLDQFKENAKFVNSKEIQVI